MFRAHLAALVVLAIGLGLAVNLPTASAESGETVTTELQPGLNLAGWTESEAPVSAVFEAIPGLTYVYAWDADDQGFRWAAQTDSGVVGDLERLTPGMGLWLDLGGQEALTWRRPLIPQTGLASLREGWNLIVWAGDDGVPTSHALRHLGSLVTATLDADDQEPTRLGRGGTFWLRASAPKQWWQLDEPPRIEFIGDLLDAQTERLRASVEDVVAYYANRFGFGVPGLTIRFGDDRIRSCALYAHPTIIMKTGCHVTLAHEYAHAVQRSLGGLRSHEAAWLVEGVADRWAAQYDDALGIEAYSDHFREIVLGHAYFTTGRLQDMETQAELVDHDPFYSLAHLATEWLADFAGEGAFRDYFARRSESASWRDTFSVVFGVTVAEFYHHFESYRAEVLDLPGRIRALVLRPDGLPQEGVVIKAIGPGGTPVAPVRTRATGDVQWVLERGAYTLSLFSGDCPLDWSIPGEATASSSADFEVGNGDDGELVIRLSAPVSEQCRWIRGTLTDLDGNPRVGARVTAALEPAGSTVTGGAISLSAVSRRDGGFGLQVSSDVFRVHLQPLRNNAYLGGRTGFSNDTARTLVLEPGGPDAEGVVVSYGVIGGSVLDAEGKPVGGVHLYLRPDTSAPARTGSTGQFLLAVPRGAHMLEIHCPQGGSGWYGGDTGFSHSPDAAALIHVSSSDVSDIVITLPVVRSEMLRDGCPEPLRGVNGVVQGSEGEPLKGVRVSVADRAPGEAGGRLQSFTYTLATGRFSLSARSVPDYLQVYLHPETNCPAGPADRGEWVVLGWTRRGGAFTPSTDLPVGLSVEAADGQGIVIRLPPTCP